MEKLIYRLLIKASDNQSNLNDEYETYKTLYWFPAEPAGALKLYLNTFGHSCRESVIHRICEMRIERKNIANGLISMTSIGEKVIDWKQPIKVEPISKEALEEFHKISNVEAEKAVRFINMIEKEAGLKQITKLYRAEMDKNTLDAIASKASLRSIKKIYRYFFYMRMPKEWMKSPYMLSLAILILRTGASFNVPEFSSTAEFIAWLTNTPRSNNKRSGSIFDSGRTLHMSGDDIFLKRSMPLCINLLSQANSIFDKSKLHWWHPDRLGNNHEPGSIYSMAYEGINTLISGKSLDRNLRERFIKAKKEWSSKKRKLSSGGAVNAKKRIVGA